MASSAVGRQKNVGGSEERLDGQRIGLPDSVPATEVFQDIESALLAASDQLHRLPSAPELSPVAGLYRRAK